MKKWPDNGPQILWTTDDIGKGYSSVSISENVIYVTGKKDTLEYLTAINKQGTIKWQIPYGSASRQSYPETRCTPTIENDKIYVISGRGEVVCIDATQAKKIWSVDAWNKFEGKFGTWGIAENPLIVDNKVIFTPGGHKTTMVALDKQTGKTIWMSESLHDTTAYVSPILIHYRNKKIIVNVTARYIFGVNAEDGKILWTYKYGDLDTSTLHRNAPIINAVSPIYRDGHIFVTSGYNHVGAMLKLSPDGSGVSLTWKQPTLDTHHGGVVLVDGYIYGSNWINNSKGNWVCLDWKTGKVMYEKNWNTKGSIISSDGMLYCYDERKGNMALVRTTPNDFEIVSTFRISLGMGPHWAHPVIHNGVLYIRHGDVLIAYHINST